MDTVTPTVQLNNSKETIPGTYDVRFMNYCQKIDITNKQLPGDENLEVPG